MTPYDLGYLIGQYIAAILTGWLLAPVVALVVLAVAWLVQRYKTSRLTSESTTDILETHDRTTAPRGQGR